MDNLIPFKNLKLDDFPHHLLGKFFTDSTPPSMEETESSLREQLPQILPENMILRTENNDLFFLNFKEKEDKAFVLCHGPWVVNGVMLIIKELTNNSNEIDFTVTNLRAIAVGLPFYLKEDLFHIKTLLISHGNVKPTLVYLKNKDLVFRAETDLKKPLNPGFFFDENRYVEFKYTNIGDFCYNCGIIGHVKSNCDQESPKERILKATLKTPVYGPWLRLHQTPNSFQIDLKLVIEEKEEDVKECEKTLQYRQFCIKINFNEVVVCNSDSSSFTSSSHSFRFPCLYLDSTDLTTSKAREIIESEINENAPFPVKDMNGERSNLISSVLEEMNVIRKKNSDDKWLTLKLEVNRRHKLPPVTYETTLWGREDLRCVREIERKMSELMEKKVEEQSHLDSVSLWEEDIRDALADIGYLDYPYLFDVTSRAERAIREANETMISSIEEAIEMAISATSCPKPAEREAVEKLQCKKVMGSEIDKLDPCVICSEEMFLGEEVTVLPCSHVFHRLCVQEWFRVGHKCPLCGFELPLQH